MVEETSAELGIERRPIEDDEVLKRCLYPLINEGARILEDGIAIRPCDIDIVYINGYGFPEVTGGPMFWADQIGLDNILADIKKFEAEYGGDIWNQRHCWRSWLLKARTSPACKAKREQRGCPRAALLHRSEER